MKIGPLQIEPPLILAPLAGYSSWPMRLLCRRFGAALTVTEMVSSTAVALRRLQSDVLYALKTHPEDRPLAIQLFGPHPDEMAEAARTLGAMEADIIDLNMGCPVKKITRNGAGAALMQDLTRAESIIRAVRRSIDVPLTVKMRLGWDRQSRNAVELARICEGEGVDAVIVHGRERSRGFSGEPDLDAIREVVRAVGIPVIGNGGIASKEDADRMIEHTGCAGVMPARVAIGAPWIFAAMAKGPDHPEANPTRAQKGEIAIRHLRMMIDYSDEDRAASEIRKHLVWYSRGIPEAVSFRRDLFQVKKAHEIESLIRRYFIDNTEKD